MNRLVIYAKYRVLCAPANKFYLQPQDADVQKLRLKGHFSKRSSIQETRTRERPCLFRPPEVHCRTQNLRTHEQTSHILPIHG